MRRLTVLLAAVSVAVLLAAGAAVAANIIGTAGPDVLMGTDENDVMRGGDGSDTMSGMVGADNVQGGKGHDKLYGADAGQSDMGTESDSLYGEDGDDQLLGGSGADVLYGGPDNDTISDGPEDDAAVDDIRSGGANDTIRSANIPHAKDNVICGDGPNDRVTADPLDAVDRATCENVEVVREVVVDLEGDQTVDQALRVAESAGAFPEEVIATYRVGEGEEYAAGYLPQEGEPLPSAQEVTQTMISAFQEDMQLVRESDAPDTPQGAVELPEDRLTATPEEEAAKEQAVISELTSVVDALQSNGAQIDVMTMQTAAPTNQIEGDPAVASATDENTETAPPETAEEPPLTTVNDGANDSNWAPKRGFVKTACCAGDRNLRFAYQKFEWNKWRMSNLKNKNSRPWYEADNLYVRDRGTYLGKVGYWTSNMPRKYLDTEFLDRFTSPDVRVMSVGSLQVEDLKPDRWYFTTIRAFKGNQDSDGAGANAQYGIRRNEYCLSGSLSDAPKRRWNAWCAIQGSASDVLVGLGDYRAPGSARWYSITK